jgi:type II restriction enzyme
MVGFFVYMDFFSIFVFQNKHNYMSQSQKLRKNTNQHSQKNTESQQQDVKIKDVVEKLLKKMKEEYPKLNFGCESEYPVRVLEEMVLSGIVQTKEKTTIKPDGGLVWVEINGEKYYILVSEQKKQGTNDKRLIEGKSKQSNGNAVERLGKNVIAVEILFGDEDITPIVAFLQGCDFFDEESTIPDRVRTIAKFQPMNQINLYKKQIQKYNWFAGSFFMRGHSMVEKPGTSDWTFDEMSTILQNVATQSTEYYLSKYGK